MRLDHVNLCVPGDGVSAETSWLVDILGYRRVEPGPEASRFGTGNLHWFETDDGTQVHLTVDLEHRPSARAHTAVLVGDSLDDVVGKVEATTGQETLAITFDGGRHVFANDPAGNLWELIGPPAS